MAQCEQCDKPSVYSVGEITLCESCYREYCEEHDNEEKRKKILDDFWCNQ